MLSCFLILFVFVCVIYSLSHQHPDGYCDHQFPEVREFTNLKLKHLTGTSPFASPLICVIEQLLSAMVIGPRMVLAGTTLRLGAVR
jgi:hypothetical protein